MKFDLCNYILNEALSSSIVRDIMNEPSGFFKHVAPRTEKNGEGDRAFAPNAHSVGRDAFFNLYKLKQFINRYLPKTTITAYRQINSSQTHVNGRRNTVPVLINSNDPLYRLPNEEILKIHKRYNEMVEKVKKQTMNIGKRPSGALFAEILSYNDSSYARSTKVELSNLTNSYFKKYTVAELKKWAHNSDLPEGYVYMFFTAAGEFLCACTDEMITTVNPLMEVTFPKQGALSKYMGVQSYKQMAEMDKQKLHDLEGLFPASVITYSKDNKTKLEWPLPYNFEYYSSNDKGPVSRYDARTMSPSAAFGSEYGYKRYKPGKPWVSTSNIAQISGWHKNPDNYCITFNNTKYWQLGAHFPAGVTNDQEHPVPYARNIANRRLKRTSLFRMSATWAQRMMANNKFDKDFRIIPHKLMAMYYDNCLTRGMSSKLSNYAEAVVVTVKETVDGQVKLVPKVIKMDDFHLQSGPGGEPLVDASGYTILYISTTNEYEKICQSNNADRYKELKTMKAAARQSEQVVHTQEQFQDRLLSFMQTRDELLELSRTVVTNRSIDPKKRQQISRLVFGNPAQDGITSLANIENKLATVVTQCGGCIDALLTAIDNKSLMTRNKTAYVDRIKQYNSNIDESVKNCQKTFDELEPYIEKIKAEIESAVELLSNE